MTPADRFTAEEIQVIADMMMLYDGYVMLRTAYPNHSILTPFEALYKRMIQKYQPLLQAYSEATRSGGVVTP